MASKQIRSNADTIKERARAILPSFGASGDPWRQGAAYTTMSGMYNEGNLGHGKEYGDNCNAYSDRYGTAGGMNEDNLPFPQKPEAAQKPDARMKGGAAESYRVTVTQVVQ